MASVFVYRDILHMNIRINGKQYRKSTGLKNTKANLLLVQQKILPEFLDKTLHQRNDDVKLEYYIDRFLEEKKYSLKQRTLYRYTNIIEQWISPRYKSFKVTDVKTSHLKHYINQQYSLGKSAKTVELYRTVFSGILQEAVYDGVLGVNPFVNIRRKARLKPSVTPFSCEEVKLLLENSEGWLKNYIAFAVYTGLRSGELIGLKWKDIGSRVIQVRRTRDFNTDTVPKTLSSIRDIPLFEVLKVYITSQRQITGSQVYVFVKRDGSPWSDTQNISQRYWYPLLERVGLKKEECMR